jgi:hypothetical protein
MNVHVHKMSKTPSLTEQLFISQDRATARAVSHRPITADASGVFQSSSREICGSGVPGVVKPPPPPQKFRSFDKAEQNSRLRGKYIRNSLIRIRASLICKLSGTPY